MIVHKLILWAWLIMSAAMLTSCAAAAHESSPPPEGRLTAEVAPGRAEDRNEPGMAAVRKDAGSQKKPLAGPPAAPDGSVKPDHLRVAAVGDIMMGTEGMLPADGGVSLFSAVKKYTRESDIVFGNLEGPLTDVGQSTKTSIPGRTYFFRTPPAYARFLVEAGFNLMSIANNHANDYGPEGQQQTIDTLKKNGILYSGPPGSMAVKTIRGRKVALIAFHTSPACNCMNDIAAAKKMVAQACQGHDLVIVSFHGGAEGAAARRTPEGSEAFLGEDRGDVRKFSRTMIDAGAALVIGHGPHVPRAMEVYQGRLIAYSLGNFCTGRGINVKGFTGYAPLLQVELAERGRLIGGRVVSFIQTSGQPPQLDPENKAATFIHQLGLEDFPKSNAVDAQGRLTIPKEVHEKGPDRDLGKTKN